MRQQFTPHQAVRIKTGKHLGLVATVVESRPETGMVKVQAEGVKDDKPFTLERWLKAAQLEHHA